MGRKRIRAVLMAAVLSCGVSGIAFGQEGAASAFKDGKAAFEAGQFDKARALFQTASQTDTKNPEVFLWLGKANYQLGQVDEAVAAWQRTTALAPEEPYSRQMLQVLTGQKSTAETRIAVITSLLRDGLWEAAANNADRLLSDKALTPTQRTRASILRAQAYLARNGVAQVLETTSELIATDPALANDAEIRTLIGQAKVRSGNAPEGLAVLRDVIAKQPATPAAALAHLEILKFELDHDATPAKADELAKWIAAHPDHASVRDARRQLLATYLRQAQAGGEPARDASLSPADLAALDVAAQLYKQLARSEAATELTNQIVTHLNERYAKYGAFAAAKSGIDALLKNELPAFSRLVAFRTQAGYAAEQAMQDLTAQVQAGKVQGTADALPPALTEAVNWYAAVNKEPGGGAWKDQAALADRVRSLAGQLAWPAAPTALKPPLAWAVQIALPVVKANADAAAVSAAAATVGRAAGEVAEAERNDPKGLALGINSSLLAVLSKDRKEWPEAAWRQVDLLDMAAAAMFRTNVEAGKSTDNAKLSQSQQDLIEMLAQIVKQNASAAPRAFERLNVHLSPWTGFGQYETTEAAYAQLAAALPEAQRQQVELALVNLWVRQAINEQNRLATAGLATPRQLDPQLAKAMRRLYQLQDNLVPTDPFLAQVRSLSESIIDSYRAKQDYEAARAAASTKPEGADAKPSPAGDIYIQFQLARLSSEVAWRDLNKQLQSFGGSKALALSDTMKAAIAAHTKFIADHPTDPLTVSSTASLFSLAEVFEQQNAFDAAAQIYREIAAFAAKRPTLSQAAPGTVHLEERAAFAAIVAAESKARNALRIERNSAKGPVKPPQKLSEDYAAALTAYETFIKDRPGSVLVGNAVVRVMTIAQDWAQIEAWDIADWVYGELQKPELKVRDPERLAFARGICQVGKVMPEHALQVLGALTAGRDPAGAPSSSSPTAVAATPTPTAPGTQPMGGIAGEGRALFGNASRSGRVGGGRGPANPHPDAAASGGSIRSEDAMARADREVLAAISAQEARRSAMVARLRDTAESSLLMNQPGEKAKRLSDDKSGRVVPQREQQAQSIDDAPPVLSEEEIARQSAALEAAHKIFRGIRTNYPNSTSAAAARGEIFVIAGHWRAVGQWQRAADLTRAFLTDNPKDPQLPQLRLAIAQDTLTWAAESAEPIKAGINRQQFLAEMSKRFDAGRAELAKIVAEFPDERQLRQDAQWQLATSFLKQAHTIGSQSPTLARGQYVRAVKEMQRAAGEYFDHPQIQTIPQVLWDISQELSSRGFHEEAISVWNDLVIQYPASALAQQAAAQMAQTYQSQLGRPLRAAEVYLEINFRRGGNDRAAQDAIYQIGAGLKQQSRWVESMHVLQTFVASFPTHPQAGEAMTMIGQIHQTNEVWADAIEAYQRVTNEYASSGQWVQEARWAIAECTMNLSRWREAIGAYQSFVGAYPNDARVPEANRRTGILKDLAKYQQLVDEDGPKAFDAQFQIATMVQTQLSNPTKAVAEFRKVAQKWPQSHLADDALHQVGLSYLQMGRTADARVAMREMATRYSDSPLADDALLAIGKSYEEEAQQIAGYTREQQFDLNKGVAQKQAYSRLNNDRAGQRAAQQAKVQQLRKAGEGQKAELEEARGANGNFLWDQANVSNAAAQAQQDIEALTASQLADRQDKINAALRKSVESYAAAAKVPGADKAGEALLRIATIYGERLNDSQAAMATWLEIVRQFSGTAVAEEASWRIAQNYERTAKFADAIEAYKAFLRNYRGSTRAADAQFAVAENYEHLGEWVKAMDSYGNYVNSFPQGTMVDKAKEQITWIKTYRL